MTTTVTVRYRVQIEERGRETRSAGRFGWYNTDWCNSIVRDDDQGALGLLKNARNINPGRRYRLMKDTVMTSIEEIES